MFNSQFSPCSNKARRQKLTIFLGVLFGLVMVNTFQAMAGNYELLTTINIKAKSITTDFLNNVYVISEDNKVMKYDSTGTLINTFSDNRYGAVTSVDATSPFNVVLFYKDFATVVTTDMRLNTRRLYRLPSIGINNVAAVCLSYDNYLWVYDSDAARLKKIDANYTVVQQSPDLRNLLGENINPNFLVERDGFIYLNIPGVGIILFDIYGTFYTSVSNTDILNDQLSVFQVVQQKVVYLNEGSLFIYEISSREQDGIRLPINGGVRDVKIEKGRLFILTDDKLQVYVQTG